MVQDRVMKKLYCNYNSDENDRVRLESWVWFFLGQHSCEVIFTLVYMVITGLSNIHGEELLLIVQEPGDIGLK